jgi:hypothetical protein
MEKTPNSSAPTLKLVNGPAGRDYSPYLYGPIIFAIFGRTEEGVVSHSSQCRCCFALCQTIRKRELLCCAIHSTHLGYLVLNPFDRRPIDPLDFLTVLQPGYCLL